MGVITLNSEEKHLRWRATTTAFSLRTPYPVPRFLVPNPCLTIQGKGFGNQDEGCSEAARYRWSRGSRSASAVTVFLLLLEINIHTTHEQRQNYRNSPRSPRTCRPAATTHSADNQQMRTPHPFRLTTAPRIPNPLRLTAVSLIRHADTLIRDSGFGIRDSGIPPPKILW